MSGWSYKELGDGVEAHNPHSQMQEQFWEFLKAAGAPTEMAMFSHYDIRSNVVTVYFSPAAESAARAFGAEPCDKPSLEGLSLSLGDQRCLELLFPDSE